MGSGNFAQSEYVMRKIFLICLWHAVYQVPCMGIDFYSCSSIVEQLHIQTVSILFLLHCDCIFIVIFLGICICDFFCIDIFTAFLYAL